MNPFSPTNQAAKEVARLFDAHVCSIYEVCEIAGPDGEESRKQLQLVGSFGWDRIKTPHGEQEKRHGPNPELVERPCPASRSAIPARWTGMTTYVGFQNRPLRCKDLRKTRVVKEKDGSLYAVVRDEKACEVPATGGSYLGMPITVDSSGETEVLGVVYCIRFFEDCSEVEAKNEPFSEDEKQYLEYYQPFLGIAMSQEKIRSEQVQKLLGIAMVSPSEERPLDQIARQAHSLVPADVSAAALFLEDPTDPGGTDDHPVFRRRATTGQTFDATYRAGNDSLTGWVIKNRKPLITGDMKRDLREPDGRLWKMDVRHQDKPGELAPGDARSFAAVPISREREDEEQPRVIGVIRVSSMHPHAFTYHDLRMLQALAQQTDRILLEQEKLQEEKKLFLHLEDASERPIIAADSRGKIIRFNKAASDLLGVKKIRPEDNRSIVDVVYGDCRTLAGATQHALEASEEGKIRAHHSLCFRDCEETGEQIVIPVRVSANFLWEEGPILGRARRAEDGSRLGSIGYLEDLRGDSKPVEKVTVINWSDDEKAYTVDPAFTEQVKKIHRMSRFAAIRGETRANGESERDPHAPVLITGETGTGKESVFKAVARALGRTDESKWKILNCATLTETVAAAELFGAVEGAYTDSPEGGLEGIFQPDQEDSTVFLDEVHHLSLADQAKLLRVIDKGKIRPVGAPTEVPMTNVQIIVATNEDLEKLVDEGRFREDLMYRLRGIVIKVPPLKERRADVMQLATLFLKKKTRISSDTSPRPDKPISFDSSAIHALLSYDWPGNVRELERTIEAAVNHWCSRENEKREVRLISAEDLPEWATRAEEETVLMCSYPEARLPDPVEQRIAAIADERIAAHSRRFHEMGGSGRGVPREESEEMYGSLTEYLMAWARDSNEVRILIVTKKRKELRELLRSRKDHYSDCKDSNFYSSFNKVRDMLLEEDGHASIDMSGAPRSSESSESPPDSIHTQGKDLFTNSEADG